MPAFVVYARKSPGESKETSIDYQVDFATEDGRRRGMTLDTMRGVRYYKGRRIDSPTTLKDGKIIAPIPGVYTDELSHGSSNVRPAFKLLIEDCRAGLVKNIVLYRGDRLTRSKVVKPVLSAGFKQRGIRVLAGDNPNEDVLLGDLTGVLSENERVILRQRTTNALATIRKTKRIGKRPKGFEINGTGIRPSATAQAFYENRPDDPHVLVGTPGALALKLKSVSSIIRLFANIRAYNEGRIEQRLADQRPYREARIAKMHSSEEEEERAVLHMLVDFVPNIRELL